MSRLQSLQIELTHLREELHIRDQLVQQLSQELFRLVTETTNPESAPEPASGQPQAEMLSIQAQLHSISQHVEFYQEQIHARDLEIQQLRRTVQELTQHSQRLERVLQELPEVYRRKFAGRMAPLQEKVGAIQQENQQLQAELRRSSHQVAPQVRKSDRRVELPQFSHLNSPSLLSASLKSAID